SLNFSSALEATRFWENASAQLATAAGESGIPARVVLGDVASSGSIWVRHERRILQFFNNEYQVHLRVVPQEFLNRPIRHAKVRDRSRMQVQAEPDAPFKPGRSG